MATVHRSDSTAGPYRATRLWNEVIHDFCCGMPLRKHRRHMRSYDNCFVASEAVDWLHYYLQRNHKFGPHVTRQQTVQLLQKFFKSGIIQNVHRTKSDRSENEFQDNKTLYRFVVFSNGTHKSPRQPLNSIVPGSFSHHLNLLTNDFQNKLVLARHEPGSQPDIKRLPLHEAKKDAEFQECCFVARSLSLQEIEKIWKNVTISRLSQLLNLKNIESVLNLSQVHGKHVMYNMTRISKTGVVSLIDKTDDLPHWVLSAMKCLANWPNASGCGSCLPKYPGFEIDVFKVVRDYFNSLDRPLVPYSLYHLCLVSYCGVKKEDEDNNLQGNKRKNMSAIHSKCNNLPEMISMMSLSSEKGQKTSTPLGQACSLSEHGEHDEPDGFSSPKTKNPFLNLHKGQHHSRNDDDNGARSNSNVSAAPAAASPSLYYETAFTFASPVTRVVPRTSAANAAFTSRSTKLLGKHLLSAQNSTSTLSACSRGRSSVRSFSGGFVNAGFEDSSLKLHPFPSDSEDDFLNEQQHHQSFASSCQKSLSAENILEGRTNFSLKLDIDQSSSTASGTRSALLKSKCNSDDKLEASLSRWNRRSSGDEYVRNDQLGDDRSMGSSYHTASVFDTLAESWCTVQEPHSICCDHRNKESLHCSERCKLSASSFRQCETSSVGVQTSFTDLQSLDDNLPMASFLSRSLGAKEIPRESVQKGDRKADNVSQSCITERLQLSMLFIPAPNRRALHLLLRMMRKMLLNTQLKISQEMSMKELLQLSFVRPIIHASQEADYDEVCARDLVMFLVDNCESVLTPSPELRKEVDEVIGMMQRSKIKYTVDDACPLTYCRQVTLQRYEDQKHALSQTALSELLGNIIHDPSVTEKERKRKLKQFKENHPEIYYSHFPPDRRGSNKNSPHLNRKWSKNLLAKIKTIRI